MKPNVKPTAIIGVIFVACTLGWATFNAKNTNAPGIENRSNEPTSKLENWNVLTNASHTLQYPPEATGEARENEESIVFFMGQKQITSGRTQTELFDGYSVRIGKMEPTSETSPEQSAIQEKENAQQNCLSYNEASVSPLKNVFVSGQSAFQYTVMNCYIDYTETILSFNGTLYRISQSYVGDLADQEKYKEITEKIVTSIRFQ